MTITVPVYSKWISGAPGGGAKGGLHIDKMNLKVGLPNGARRTLNMSITNNEPTEQSSFEIDMSSIVRVLAMEQGIKIQGEYWQGRVTSVTLSIPHLLGNPFSGSTIKNFYTNDHPVYYFELGLAKAVAILGMLLIVLILWTGFLLLRH